MLIITDEQLDIMGEVKLPDFYQYVENYINKEFPDFSKNRKIDLTSWIATTYFQAKKYNINTIKTHIKFVNYCCLFGDDFDTKYPFANTILNSNETANSKMVLLKDAFIDELNREQS